MTSNPAKVLTVDRQSHQYRVLVKIGYLGSFDTLRFGDSKPFIGACHNSRLDLFYFGDPRLKQGGRPRCGLFSDRVMLRD